jgi:hypothetical protein
MAQQPRTIQPADAQDERLAGVSLAAAYTYAYLPTVLDDAGRAKDQPAVLNGYLWPLRADDHPTAAMADDLADLAEAGLLCRYVVDDASYLHMPEWKRRQNVPRGAASDLPPCPDHDKPFDDVVSETLHTVSEQVNAFLGGAAGIDKDQIRDSVGRLVEDVTFLVDPDKASTFGQKVREFLGETADPEHVDIERVNGPDAEDGPNAEDAAADDDANPWEDVTDNPRDGKVSG